MNGLDLALVVAAFSFVLSMFRIAAGPTTADRAVAADVGYLIVVGALAILSVRLDTPLFVDVVLVAVVLGFLALLAFAWLVDWRSR